MKVYYGLPAVMKWHRRKIQELLGVDFSSLKKDLSWSALKRLTKPNASASKAKISNILKVLKTEYQRVHDDKLPECHSLQKLCGLEPGLSAEQERKRLKCYYRVTCLKMHPDKWQNGSDYEKEFSNIVTQELNGLWEQYNNPSHPGLSFSEGGGGEAPQRRWKPEAGDLKTGGLGSYEKPETFDFYVPMSPWRNDGNRYTIPAEEDYVTQVWDESKENIASLSVDKDKLQAYLNKAARRVAFTSDDAWRMVCEHSLRHAWLMVHIRLPEDCLSFKSEADLSNAINVGERLYPFMEAGSRVEVLDFNLKVRDEVCGVTNRSVRDKITQFLGWDRCLEWSAGSELIGGARAKKLPALTDAAPAEQAGEMVEFSAQPPQSEQIGVIVTLGPNDNDEVVVTTADDRQAELGLEQEQQGLMAAAHERKMTALRDFGAIGLLIFIAPVLVLLLKLIVMACSGKKIRGEHIGNLMFQKGEPAATREVAVSVGLSTTSSMG